MDEEFLSVKRYFHGLHIPLNDEWLGSCIEWYHEDNSNSSCLESLHRKVYQQWLMLDLSLVEVSVLPLNLAQHKKYVLNGVFSLQILQIIDTSKSKLLQLQKIRNVSAYSHTTADYNSEQADGRRLLLLTLSDGVTKIEAIEYSPIKSLNVNLPPGTKIKIKGPVTIRRGQIHLEEKNVDVLGGEVAELLVSNAAENILARALDLPENLNPKIVGDNFTIKEDKTSITKETLFDVDQFLVPSNQTKSVQKVITITDEEEEKLLASEIDLIVAQEEIKQKIKMADLNQKSINSNKPKTTNTANFISKDEAKQMEDEIDTLLEIENYLRETSTANQNKTHTAKNKAQSPPKVKSIQPKKNITTVTRKPNADEEIRIKAEIAMVVDVKQSSMKECNILKTNSSQRKSSTSNAKKIDVSCTAPSTSSVISRISNKKSSVLTETSNACDGSLFEDMDIDAHLDMIDAQIMQKREVTSIACLKQKNLCNETFTIKAKFNSVIEKLTVSNNAWYLKIKIEDESGDLQVYVHTDVITKIMGHTPTSIMALRNDINKNKSATAVVMKTIEGLKTTIMELNGLMEITFNANEGTFTITALV